MSATVEQMLDAAGMVVISKQDLEELQAKAARLEAIEAEKDALENTLRMLTFS
jgi:phage FluMu protein gp41